MSALLKRIDPVILVLAVGIPVLFCVASLTVRSGVEKRVDVLYYDPLWSIEPNPALLENLTRLAREHNMTIDVRLGENATLSMLHSFFKYRIVIIRAHGALSRYGAVVWTGEPWEPNWRNYLPAIAVWGITDDVVRGIVEYNNTVYEYIAATPNWFHHNIQDTEHKKTIIIYIGCRTYDKTLARVLVQKGAIAYIGTRDYLPTPIADQLIYNITSILLSNKPLLEKLYIISRMDYVGVYTVLDFYRSRV